MQPKSLISESDKKWFEEVYNSLNTFSPFLPTFLNSYEVFNSLKEGLSLSMLLDKTKTIKEHLPHATKESVDSIITFQFNDEPEYWTALFNHFLETTPEYIFQTNAEDFIFLQQQHNQFLDWLYKPLQAQYDAFLQDVITFNYSPFEIDPALFKK